MTDISVEHLKATGPEDKILIEPIGFYMATTGEYVGRTLISLTVKACELVHS